MKATALVVANRTATAPELLATLVARSQDSALRIELLVPPMTVGREGREAANRTLEDALTRYAEAGLEATGRVGSDTDVVVAVVEAYEPLRHDEIVVSTLPASTSHWLTIDGPARIGRLTGAIVRHVVAREPRATPAPTPRPRRRSDGVLAPLMALGSGRRK
jgi:hypothetical protein